MPVYPVTLLAFLASFFFITCTEPLKEDKIDKVLALILCILHDDGVMGNILYPLYIRAYRHHDALFNHTIQ